jgi:Ala-tRNA(Pro) deacylase
MLETERIKSECTRLGLHPTYLEHEPALTSEDAARIRGTTLGQGIKSLVFTDGKGLWILVDLPSDKKADQTKVAAAFGLGRKDIRLATPEEVLEITGCEVGAVPPFGHKTALKTLVDKGIYANTESAFNIGLRTHSVRIPTAEMRVVFDAIGAKEGDFAKI